MKRNISKILILMIMIAALSACASFEKNTYRTMYLAGTAYDAGMKSVSSLQSQGIIKPEQREEINKIGNLFYVSYQASVNLFALWKKTQTVEAKDRLIVAIADMSTRWRKFAEIVNRLKPATVPPTIEGMK